MRDNAPTNQPPFPLQQERIHHPIGIKRALVLFFTVGILGWFRCLPYQISVLICYPFYKIISVTTGQKIFKACVNLHQKRKMKKSIILLSAVLLGLVAGVLLSVFLSIYFPVLLVSLTHLNHSMGYLLAALNGGVWGFYLASYYKQNKFLSMITGIVLAPIVLKFLLPTIIHSPLVSYVNNLIFGKNLLPHNTTFLLTIELALFCSSILSTLFFLVAKDCLRVYNYIRYGHSNADGYITHLNNNDKLLHLYNVSSASFLILLKFCHNKIMDKEIEKKERQQYKTLYKTIMYDTHTDTTAAQVRKWLETYTKQYTNSAKPFHPPAFDNSKRYHHSYFKLNTNQYRLMTKSESLQTNPPLPDDKSFKCATEIFLNNTY